MNVPVSLTFHFVNTSKQKWYQTLSKDSIERFWKKSCFVGGDVVVVVRAKRESILWIMQQCRELIILWIKSQHYIYTQLLEIAAMFLKSSFASPPKRGKLSYRLILKRLIGVGTTYAVRSSEGYSQSLSKSVPPPRKYITRLKNK